MAEMASSGSSAAAQKPTVFFVHGAWHQSAHFQGIVDRLAADGYPAVAPTQPTYDPGPEQLRTLTLHDDAAFVGRELQRLADAGREIVVVLHSYGGMVGTQGVHENLGRKWRAAAGKRGGVVRLVYMAAFLLPEGASLGDNFGGSLPPFIQVADDGSCRVADEHEIFYKDVADTKRVAELLALTRPHVAAAQLTRLTYAAYMHHPLTYMVATRDNALPPEAQRGMVAFCRGKGLQVDVLEIEADHSPYVCREAELAVMLEKIVDACAGGTS